MAALQIENKLRTCLVKTYDTQSFRIVETGTRKALFHGWCHRSSVIPPSPFKGDHQGGVVADTYAIVEYEDGSMHQACIEDVQFTDNIFEEYAFPEDGNNA